MKTHRTPSTINSPSGFTLVEAIVSLGLLMVTVLAFTQFITHFKTSVRREKLMVLQNDYIAHIEENLAAVGTCSKLLVEATKDLADAPSALSGQPAFPLKLEAFTQITSELNDSIFSLKAVRLEYANENPSGDRTNWPNSKTYRATLTFELAYAKESYNAFDYVLRPIKIPLMLFDGKEKNLWSEIQCSSLRSEDSFLIGQICNMYGGTLTDGIHCDTVRMIRRPSTNFAGSAASPNYAPSVNWRVLQASPIVLSQSPASPSQRLSFADAICYLDQLLVMTPARPQVTTPVRETTRFCRHPGSKNIISSDTANIFNEVR